jgi:hypothetical protein
LILPPSDLLIPFRDGSAGPPLPGPLLRKFVEAREKKRVVAVARCARLIVKRN